MLTEKEKQLVLEMFKWRYPNKKIPSDPRVEEVFVRMGCRVFGIYTDLRHHYSLTIHGSIFQEEDPVKAYKVNILSEVMASANERIKEITLDLEDAKAWLANCERRLKEVLNG